MGSPARIDCIDALKELRTFLCNIGKKISVALDDADFDVARTLHWLKDDRYPYWKKEVRLRQEALVKAKLELKRKQFFEKAPGHYFADEKKAVAVAQRRFDEAEDKLKKVRGWIPVLEKESYACRGALQGLSNFVQIELANRRTQIDEMICALESYVDLSAPTAAGAAEFVKADAGEEISDVSRAAEERRPELTEMEQLCGKLRRRCPLKDLTFKLPMVKPALTQLKDLTVSDEIQEIIEKNKRDKSSFCGDDKVVLDRSIEGCDYIYIENLAAGGDAEIKWYAAPVKAEDAASYSVCEVREFAAGCPVVEELLSLPEGWLVVIKKSAVEAVFDADNKLKGSRPANESA